MSPRSTEQFNKMREATKSKIEASATALFSHKGMSVTVGDIAKHAGISQGLLYSHYASKAALIEALVTKAQSTSSHAIGTLMEQPINAKDKIEYLSNMMLEMLCSPEHEGTQLFLFMVQVGMNLADAPEMIQNLPSSRLPVEYLSKIIIQGQKEDTVKPGSPMSLATIYWAAIQGLCCYSLVNMPIPKEPTPLSQILLK